MGFGGFGKGFKEAYKDSQERADKFNKEREKEEELERRRRLEEEEKKKEKEKEEENRLKKEKEKNKEGGLGDFQGETATKVENPEEDNYIDEEVDTLDNLVREKTDSMDEEISDQKEGKRKSDI